MIVGGMAEFQRAGKWCDKLPLIFTWTQSV